MSIMPYMGRCHTCGHDHSKITFSVPQPLPEVKCPHGKIPGEECVNCRELYYAHKHIERLVITVSAPDCRTLPEKLGAEFEERLAAVIHTAHNYGGGENLKHIDEECAEEEAERLRMCVAEMLGFAI